MNTNPPIPDWVATNIVQERAKRHVSSVEVKHVRREGTFEDVFTAIAVSRASISLSGESRYMAPNETGFLEQTGEALGEELRWFILDSMNLTEKEIMTLLIRTQNKGAKK